MKKIVIGFYGSVLDAAKQRRRFDKWRPTLSLCRFDDFAVDRLDLICNRSYVRSANSLIADIKSLSPATEVMLHENRLEDAWDFEEVFAFLHDFARAYDFEIEENEYYVHMTTGTHVAQICLFLLTEAGYFPAKLIQTSPGKGDTTVPGDYRIIDLDLSKYDQIASRFQKEQADARAFLKSGIETRNADFNRLIDQIEQVAIGSPFPMLLMGPTGAGKTQLAQRIFELKKVRHQVSGNFVEVNCATLRGDGAMSALFGHVRGAYTGALTDRPGLLRAAHGGVLFLDEVGELGADEQAMLLRALEQKNFLPLGSDREAHSDFQLIAGTNRDLAEACRKGQFREDLLARINLWTFYLPGLAQRREDIEPNLIYELDKFSRLSGRKVTFNREAWRRYLNFATGPTALWRANFRDLNASVSRMATLALGGRIDEAVVVEEIGRLERQWHSPEANSPALEQFFDSDRIAAIDLFDRAQLAQVIVTCKASRSLAEAGRKLFQASRQQRRSRNDSDRIRKYLTKFGLRSQDVLAGNPVGEETD